MQVYRCLGGLQPAPLLRPGGWDFSFDDWVLELAEENHFNRYRALSLDAPSYENLEAFDRASFRGYCTSFEGECNTHGGYCTNPSAERERGRAKQSRRGPPTSLEHSTRLRLTGVARCLARSLASWLGEPAPEGGVKGHSSRRIDRPNL